MKVSQRFYVLQHIIIVCAVITFSTSCEYDGYSTYQVAKNKDDRDKSEIFTKHKIEIYSNIHSNQFEEAEILIGKLESSKIGNDFKNDIEKIKLFNNDRRLYIQIYKYKNLSDIAIYESNTSFGRYSSEVETIKHKKEEEIYLSASNSIEGLNHFLKAYPDNSYRYQAKGELVKLKRERERNSIEREIEFNRILTKSDVRLKRYNNDDFIKEINNYRPLNDPYRSINNGNPVQNPNSAPTVVKVEGYYKSNGTYVEPHYRTAPNTTKTDNLRYKKL